MTTLDTYSPFSVGQRVIVTSAGGRREAARIDRRHRSWKGIPPTDIAWNWLPVRFDVDGAQLCVHRDQIEAA